MTKKIDNIDQDFDNVYQNLKKKSDNINIELEELNIKRAEAIKNAVAEIDIQRENLIYKSVQIERALKALYPSEVEGYNSNLGVRQKVEWVLQSAKKVMTATDIANAIKRQEPKLKTDITPVVRLTINRMHARKNLIRYQNENITLIHYALPDWFIDERLMEGYY